MPLETDYSIVADSTLSSSPQPTPMQRDPDASVEIKRPVRTYGRRQEAPLVETPEIPSSFPSSSYSLSTHNTAPPGLSEEIPPTSPQTQLTNYDTTLNSDEDDEDASNASPKFDFSWKAKLRALDEESDTETPVESALPTSHDTAGFGRPSLLEEPNTGSKSNSLETGTAMRSPTVTSNDLFRSQPLSQEEQSPSRVPPSRDAFVLSSPKVAPPTRKRLSKIVRDSDSEPEPSKASSSTSPSSSQLIHPINTPKSRSLTTTPPTSDDEMPMKLSRSAGKRKAIPHSRPSVPPLELVEGLPSEPRMRTTSKNKSKVKALTKKEKAEMVKERSRMAAGSNASAVLSRGTLNNYTKEGLFAKLRDIPPSDPIEAYSSPPGKARTEHVVHAVLTLPAARSKTPPAQPLNLDESDSDELPEVPILSKETEEKKKKEELRRMKQRALEQLQRKNSPEARDQYDDDDLEVVVSNPKISVKEEEVRRTAKKDYISRTRRQQLQLAHVNPAKHKKSDVPIPRRHVEGSPSRVLRHSDRLDQASLSRVLVAQAMKEAQTVTKEKKAQWEKHGGHVNAAPEIPAQGLAAAMQTIAEQGLKAAEASAANRMDTDDDEDEDDGDWDPTMRGSASPQRPGNHDSGSEEENDENDENDEDNENDENMPIQKDINMAGVDDFEEDENEDSKIRSARRMVITSDSEGENDENDENAPMQRRATSSAESLGEDEHDKENNNELMYDHSDDKENTAVVRHGLLTRGSRGVFDDITAPASLEGPIADWGARSQRLNIEDDGKARRPFQDLLSDRSPSSTQLSSSLTQSFAAQLQQASPLPSTLAPAPTLKTFLGSGSADSKSFSGFSQFSEGGDSENFGAVPLLQPGFSELFESATERQRTPKRAGKGREATEEDVFSGNASARQLKRTDTLDLTQDVSAALNLQPAFQVKEGLMRKADAIFEKEQAFVMESALQKPNKKPELYVNDHGFLTQTRPIDGTPEVYRPSPSQRAYPGQSLRDPMLSPSKFRTRVPLRTLSVSSAYEPESPKHSLHRLRKAASPTQGPSSYSPSTTPPSRQNAFDLLARGAAQAQRRSEAPARVPHGLNLADYVENEAAESDDDDNAFGLVRQRTDGDDEEGEDLDQTLTELMDDKEMDEAAIAADLVLEKYQEQEQEQDQKDQELHEAAVAGLLRQKRNRGVGVDDSDEESDDEANERARRAMKKMKTTDRTDIKALADNTQTAPFAAVYNQHLKDDDDSFAYLATESNLDDLMGGNINSGADGSDGEDGYEDEYEEEPETISPQEVMRIARQMKEDGLEEAPMDPEDVSWLDKDADDDAPQVKTVRTRKVPRISQQDVGGLDMDGAMGRLFGKPADQLSTSSKQWFAQENKSRNAGTSRSVGGSAITGHARAKPKNGTTAGRGPVKAGTAAASAAPSRAVKPERSLLSAIADKSRNFG